MSPVRLMVIWILSAPSETLAVAALKPTLPFVAVAIARIDSGRLAPPMAPIDVAAPVVRLIEYRVEKVVKVKPGGVIAVRAVSLLDRMSKPLKPPALTPS